MHNDVTVGKRDHLAKAKRKDTVCSQTVVADANIPHKRRSFHSFCESVTDFFSRHNNRTTHDSPNQTCKSLTQSAFLIPNCFSFTGLDPEVVTEAVAGHAVHPVAG